jgi:hypothetical protein
MPVRAGGAKVWASDIGRVIACGIITSFIAVVAGQMARCLAEPLLRLGEELVDVPTSGRGEAIVRHRL